MKQLQSFQNRFAKKIVKSKCCKSTGAGSIPGRGVICALSLLLVLLPTPRVFPVPPVLIPPQYTQF